MIKHMVKDALCCLNQFPRKYGVSETLSPDAIVTGAGPPDYNALQLEFGSYVQVFEDNDPTNTPRARSLGAIALSPTGNAQGDYNFMSLATGAKITRHQWTEIPITEATIARVEALAKQDKQPLIQSSGLVVEWRHDMPIDDDIYDVTYDSDDESKDDRNAADVPLDASDYDVDDLADLLDADDDPRADLIPLLAPGAPHNDEQDDSDDDSDDADDGFPLPFDDEDDVINEAAEEDDSDVESDIRKWYIVR